MLIKTRYELKQKVNIKELEIPGIIVKVEVKPGVLLYNVQYWLNGKQEYAWLMEDDIIE